VREFTIGEVSPEAVAIEAGVGIGTLYRHFPTRDALVEAVYRNEVARPSESAGHLLATMTPDAALREWMKGFVAFLTAKHGMADALRAVIASGGNPYGQTRTHLLGAVSALVEAGAANETIRKDIDPLDILTALNGISLTAVDPGQIDRLLNLLLDGLSSSRQSW
jgi:AcrR family transcriptional regulator